MAIETGPRDARSLNVHFVSLLDIVCDLSVPRIIQADDTRVAVQYRNSEHTAFPANAFAEGSGQLFVDYCEDGNCNLSFLADMVRVQPGDPEAEEYMANSIGMTNPRVCVVGFVKGTPLESNEARIFTLHVNAYRTSGYTEFDLHCILPGNQRWAKTPLPRKGRPCYIIGQIVGFYEHDSRKSPLVNITQLSFLSSIAGDNGPVAGGPSDQAGPETPRPAGPLFPTAPTIEVDGNNEEEVGLGKRKPRPLNHSTLKEMLRPPKASSARALSSDESEVNEDSTEDSSTSASEDSNLSSEPEDSSNSEETSSSDSSDSDSDADSTSSTEEDDPKGKGKSRAKRTK
ncbi:hypothetical protein ACJ73_07015 [Blastomyces percursus]|uniref:Uncharacterized protein n=1 Tax=Blastomyces percursus TaxID=1658174 RepID=A0A1J9R0S5_9EURO|nr:hypothetical protein ACJ73_07015 [Blastomyces percursus]